MHTKSLRIEADPQESHSSLRRMTAQRPHTRTR
nr:MAG TPA: hypothetical protein [Caudoviricetes sp.]